MTTTTITQTVNDVITTREQADAAIADIAKWKAKEQKITGEMNQEIERVKRTHADDLNDLGKKIGDRFTQLKEWAEKNPSLFENPKSIRTVHGVMGFRTGKYELNQIEGWTEERSIEKLVELNAKAIEAREDGTADHASFMERITPFLRYVPDIDAQGIISVRECFTKKELAQIGCEIDRATRFYLTPKIESPETKVQEVA